MQPKLKLLIIYRLLKFSILYNIQRMDTIADVV